MDQHTVESYRFATTRADLILAPGERFVAGGTWQFSEPDPETTGLVDLTGMRWPAWEVGADGLSIGATCTIAELAALPPRDTWRAHPLFAESCRALLASWKVWNVATVGGNVARAYAAAAMVSLLATLDAVALVWTPDGGQRRVDVVDLVAGDGVTTLARGEVLRSFEITSRALRATAALRKIALAELGRSGSVVTARRDEDDRFTLVVTAATLTPQRLRYDDLPSEDVLRGDVDALPGFYSDPLGSQDWRRGVSAELAARVRADLVAA